METIIKELVDVLKVLLTGSNLVSFAGAGAIAWRVFKSLAKKWDAKQDVLINQLMEEMKDVKKETLRLQILQGIDSRRLSRSEVLYFYDKYKSLGGNSFVTTKVNEYINVLEEDDHNDDQIRY